MEYTVVWKVTLVELIKEVNNLIAKGWTPLGGVSSQGIALIQAMTRDIRKQ